MNHLSKTGATAIDQLRQLQVVAWQRGERLLVEQLLGRSPELPIQDESVLELICAELLLREEAGDVPTAAEYTSRFPHLATELLRQFEVHQLLGTLDGLNSMSALLSGQPAAPVDRAFDVTVLSDQDNGNHREGTSHEKFPDVQGYRILRELGRGGMGVVYQARHLQLNRIVALKMIRDSALASDAVRERFRVEAKAVARLQHPNIVQIYDYSECRGIPFFSLEYVAGGSLAEFTRHQPQPIVASVELVEKLARALDQAHREGIVHRDLKPANIMLTQVRPDGSSVDSTASPSAEIEDGASTLAQLQPKISDFGLAKILTDNQDLTHSAAMLGTCAYMSPEQAWGRSRDVGPATDIHALGLILYELLTGLTPFQSSSMAQSLDLVRFNEPLPPSQSRSEIPPALETICLRCLRKEPGDRYQSMIELADDIRRFLDGHPIAKEPASRRTYRPIAIAAVAIGFVGLIALMSGILPKSTSPKLTVTPPAARTAGEPFAFLVGVRSYRLPDQSIDLEFTESDVEELSRVLHRNGYPRKNIHLLTQWTEADNPDLAPTGQNIRTRLESLLKSCIADDTVLVAVTGMGGDLGNPAMYCYLPADGRPDQPTSLLTLADFYELFRHCPAGKKVLLVDTCQSVVADGIEWTQTPVLPEGMAVYFACAPNEASYEHSSLRHGVFSYHVLQALEGAADSNHDATIVLDELVGYTTKHVQDFVSAKYANATQSPYLVSNLPGSTPLIHLKGTAR